MTTGNGDKQLSEEERRQIFLALVDAQDHEMNVVQSRTQVSQQFGVSESQVRQIEREGIEQQWPPL
jgi:DNA-directed RNA polymerase sigma subunit (sigma70/sigma32)